MVQRVGNSDMSLLTLLCRPVHHITHYMIYTWIFAYGSVPRALRYASYVRRHPPTHPPITTPTRFLQLALSWCIFKLMVVSSCILHSISSCTQLLLHSAYLQQLCSWLSVTPRALDPLLTSLLDCCGCRLLAVVPTWWPVLAHLLLFIYHVPFVACF